MFDFRLIPLDRITYELQGYGNSNVGIEYNKVNCLRDLHCRPDQLKQITLFSIISITLCICRNDGRLANAARSTEFFQEMAD